MLGDDHRARITAGDDYAAMREVLTRRYRKVVAGEGKSPGSGADRRRQGTARGGARGLRGIGLADICVVGVAKGEERKPGLEQLILPGGARARSSCRGTIPRCTSSSRSATRRTGLRSRATGRAAARRARARRWSDRGNRRQAPPETARALRGTARPARRERGRPRAGGRHQPRAGREDLPGAALKK